MPWSVRTKARFPDRPAPPRSFVKCDQMTAPEPLRLDGHGHVERRRSSGCDQLLRFGGDCQCQVDPRPGFGLEATQVGPGPQHFKKFTLVGPAET